MSVAILISSYLPKAQRIMSLISRIRKIISYLTDGDDVWGGWEDNVDYEVNGKGGNDKLYGYTGDDI